MPGMTFQKMIMLEPKHLKVEVTNVRDKDMTVKAEETIGVQGPPRLSWSRKMAGGDRVRGQGRDDIRVQGCSCKNSW